MVEDPIQRLKKNIEKRERREERLEEKAETVFPPVFGQIYKPPKTKEEKEAWNLGAKIADEHYRIMKKKIKENLLRLSHITEVTTREVINLYNKIDKFHFSHARNGYIIRAKEQGYIAEGENYFFFFMSSWNSATHGSKEKSHC